MCMSTHLVTKLPNDKNFRCLLNGTSPPQTVGTTSPAPNVGTVILLVVIVVGVVILVVLFRVKKRKRRLVINKIQNVKFENEENDLKLKQVENT